MKHPPIRDNRGRIPNYVIIEQDGLKLLHQASGVSVPLKSRDHHDLRNASLLLKARVARHSYKEATDALRSARR